MSYLRVILGNRELLSLNEVNSLLPEGREIRTEAIQNLAKAAAENDPFCTFVYLFYYQEIAVFHNRITPS